LSPSVDPVTGLVDRPAPRPWPHGPPTIAALLDAPLAATPDRLALIDEGRTWTYRTLDDAVEQAAAALVSVGVQPGSRVAWTLPNCAELPIGFLATQRIGAIWLGINEALAPPEKQYLLDDAAVDHYIADDATLRPARGTAHLLRDDDWRELVAASTPGRPDTDIDPHAPAAMAYTSGTTGRPKGVVHSQHNLLWPGLVSLHTEPVMPAERQGTPLAHTILNMLLLGPVSALVRGSTAVVLHSTRAPELAHDIARFAITRTTIVPTIVHDLVHRDGIDPADLATLDHVVVGGAATPAPLRRAFTEKFGVRALAGYGLSEAPTGIVRESPHEPIDDIAGGDPLAPFEIMIVDAHGAEVPAGTEGEICVRATSTGEWAGCWSPMLGYWKQPDATAAALADGTLHTGDTGAVDARGRLTVTGRIAELILRGGANVSPVEVEQTLVEHPDVAEAAVFGLPDDRLGERVIASIIGAVPDPDLDAIRAHCTTRLAAYKVPEQIRVVDSFPRNAMGKVMKTALLDDTPRSKTERQ
jgi:long-chain acyl-CoA synthetase